MKRKICIVASGQPTSNPRVVKAADALQEAGYLVTVIASHWAEWAVEMDRALLRDRAWRCRYVGGHPRHERALYHWTRIKHKFFRTINEHVPFLKGKVEEALARTSQEQVAAAKKERADLYIAYSLPSLKAAAVAAKKCAAKVCFDAQDFFSGQFIGAELRGAVCRVTKRMEERYLPGCDLVIASSPLIADRYKPLCTSANMVVILNLFPVAQRPQYFRSGSSAGPLTLFWFSQTIGAGRGLEDIFAALRHFVPGQVVLTLAGDPVNGYKETVLDQAKQSGLPAEVIRFHSVINPDELVRFSAQFDVGLALEVPLEENRDIALTNKLFTYILAGNAIVATSTSAQTEIAKTLGNGVYIYQSGDVDQLAAGIKQWIQNKDKLQRARRENWEIGEKLYNWDVDKIKLLDAIGRLFGD